MSDRTAAREVVRSQHLAHWPFSRLDIWWQRRFNPVPWLLLVQLSIAWTLAWLTAVLEAAYTHNIAHITDGHVSQGRTNLHQQGWGIWGCRLLSNRQVVLIESHWARGGVQPDHHTSISKGQHTETNFHTPIPPSVNLESPIYFTPICMSLDQQAGVPGQEASKSGRTWKQKDPSKLVHLKRITEETVKALVESDY